MSTIGTTLDVHGLVAGYGGLPIVNGVSLTAEAGRVTVVIGPNGCGKSTMMRALGGVLPISGGNVRLVANQIPTDLGTMSPSERLALGLSYVPQERTGFLDMSVHENLKLGGWLWRRNRAELAPRLSRVYEVLPNLGKWRNRRMGLLSGGQQRLVELGRALVSAPRVIMLDEPTAGVAPGAAAELLEVLRGIAERDQVAVLMVEQNLEPALEVADRAYSLVAGRNSTEGPAGDVLDRLPEIVESWLWD
jgi:ABC-type branched-subunit amino acid transport system ATPase component